MAMHNDQLALTLGTVRGLIELQYPQWADRPIRRLQTAGTVNAIFRLGEGLAARFPLRATDPDLADKWLRAEASAAAELAAVSPVPTPVTVAVGAPGDGYPLPWTVQTWVAGRDATMENPTSSDAFALDLAAFICRLGTADTAGRRFTGEGRGGHLKDHDMWIETCFKESDRLLDVEPLRMMWAEYRELPEVDADAMCHGDLTPPNVLIRDGRLVGVLDGGGFGPADPALDLVSAWHLLNDRQRQQFRDAVQCGDVQWQRGMAWAFQQAIGLVWYYAESNPTMSAWGRRTLERLITAAR
jgi:aminoglycoside phosphotransferase (APT) family kinase protein